MVRVGAIRKILDGNGGRTVRYDNHRQALTDHRSESTDLLHGTLKAKNEEEPTQWPL